MKSEKTFATTDFMDNMLMFLAVLALISATYFILNDQYLYIGISKGQGVKPVVGMVDVVQSDVRIKGETSEIWRPALSAMMLREGDSIFTGEDSYSQVSLNFKGSLKAGFEVNPLSLVKFSFSEDTLSFDVDRGGLVAYLPKDMRLKVSSNGNTFVTQNRTNLVFARDVEGNTRVSVIKGKLKIKDRVKGAEEEVTENTTIQEGKNGEIEVLYTESPLDLAESKAESNNIEESLKKFGAVGSWQEKVIERESFNEKMPGNIQGNSESVDLSSKTNGDGKHQLLVMAQPLKGRKGSGKEKRNKNVLGSTKKPKIESETSTFSQKKSNNLKRTIAAPKRPKKVRPRTIKLTPRTTFPFDGLEINCQKCAKKELEFQWKKIRWANYYWFEISTSSKFEKKRTKSFKVKGTKFIRALNLNYDTPYYWRIKAYSRLKRSLWSEVSKFEIKKVRR